ncbi:MAG: multidrug effflux MFS transporter [Pseudomonadota bacterium]
MLLILIATIQPIAMNMYVPAMAAMQVDLSTTASLIQTTLSAFLIATAVGQLVIGPLSDIYGRRLVLIAGLLVFLLGTGVCVFAHDIHWLIAGRIIQGFGGCAGLVLSRAIIRDVHGTATSASQIGYVTMGMAVGPLVTPAIGGFIYEWLSWRAIFALMGAFGLVGIVAAVTRLAETHQRTKRPGVFRRWRDESMELLRSKGFWSFALTLAALCVAFFSFVSGGAFVAAFVFELSVSQYGMFFIFVVSGYIFGNFITGRFGERIGLVRMIVIGNAISLIGVAAAIVLACFDDPHPIRLFAPMLVVGIGNGFALPNAVAGCVSIRPDLAGTASGLAGAFQVGSGAIASIVVGILIDSKLFDGTTWSILLPMTFGAVAAFLLSFTLRSRALR